LKIKKRGKNFLKNVKKRKKRDQNKKRKKRFYIYGDKNALGLKLKKVTESSKY